jgi:hypothetical protein
MPSTSIHSADRGDPLGPYVNGAATWQRVASEVGHMSWGGVHITGMRRVLQPFLFHAREHITYMRT